MKIKCVLERVDFIPLLKVGGRIWQPEKTLGKGAVIEVEDAIGHQLLANYPGAFEVVSYGEAPVKTRRKQITDGDLASKDAGEPAQI